MTIKTSEQAHFQQGQRLRIFLGEAREWHGKPLHRALLELAWRQGIAGATVLRGVEGFGPEQYISTERLPELADNLPVIIEIVDSSEQIERFLPLLDEMVPRGMITVSPVTIVRKGGQL